MSDSTGLIDEITLKIDPETAEIYNTVAPELQKKVGLLFGIWLKEVTSKDPSSLKQLMDQISENAKDRGLTPEILESVLSEE